MRVTKLLTVAFLALVVGSTSTVVGFRKVESGIFSTGSTAKDSRDASLINVRKLASLLDAKCIAPSSEYLDFFKNSGFKNGMPLQQNLSLLFSSSVYKSFEADWTAVILRKMAVRLALAVFGEIYSSLLNATSKETLPTETYFASKLQSLEDVSEIIKNADSRWAKIMDSGMEQTEEALRSLTLAVISLSGQIEKVREIIDLPVSIGVVLRNRKVKNCFNPDDLNRLVSELLAITSSGGFDGNLDVEPLLPIITSLSLITGATKGGLLANAMRLVPLDSFLQFGDNNGEKNNKSRKSHSKDNPIVGLIYSLQGSKLANIGNKEKCASVRSWSDFLARGAADLGVEDVSRMRDLLYLHGNILSQADTDSFSPSVVKHLFADVKNIQNGEKSQKVAESVSTLVDNWEKKALQLKDKGLNLKELFANVVSGSGCDAVLFYLIKCTPNKESFELCVKALFNNSKALLERFKNSPIPRTAMSILLLGNLSVDRELPLEFYDLLKAFFSLSEDKKNEIKNLTVILASSLRGDSYLIPHGIYGEEKGINVDALLFGNDKNSKLVKNSLSAFTSESSESFSWKSLAADSKRMSDGFKIRWEELFGRGNKVLSSKQEFSSFPDSDDSFPSAFYSNENEKNGLYLLGFRGSNQFNNLDKALQCVFCVNAGDLLYFPFQSEYVEAVDVDPAVEGKEIERLRT